MANISPQKGVLRRVGLIYVSDDQPGIRRRRRSKGFAYIGISGRAIRAKKSLHRFATLVIPPAWRDVWICPQSRGHIQATGRDARGRKQYIYHPAWRELRDQAKYGRMVAFARSLGPLRRRLERDLRRAALCKEKVVAAVVRLLLTALIRVGNEEYTRQNGSFGATTLRDRHVNIEGAWLRFQFRGKSGVKHAIDLRDRRLAKVVKACQELPGQELFQFVGPGGVLGSVTSQDVNAYLRDATRQDFTAKDIRTWAGTVCAALALGEFEPWQSEAQAKRNIVAAIDAVAKKLGNTKAVCRRCYIHPAIFDAYLGGAFRLDEGQGARHIAKSLAHLSTDEAAVFSILRQYE
jgi:DNA topoisomerase-1